MSSHPAINPAIRIAVAAGLLLAAGAEAADPQRQKILDAYAAEATRAVPGFAGFSAERGQALYAGPHAGGDRGADACATCHTADPAARGRHHKTGRAIEPMAVSVNPARFTDMEEVEKRFARDCKNVLGRACTAEEKGDFIAFLSSR
jgi:hypothetical protein